MNDPEQLLRAARLAPPSSALDRRLQEAFANAAPAQPARRPAKPWWWIGALAATGIAATVALVATRPPHLPIPAATAPTLCNIEPQGSMRLLLLEPLAGQRTPPCFAVSVTTP